MEKEKKQLVEWEQNEMTRALTCYAMLIFGQPTQPLQPSTLLTLLDIYPSSFSITPIISNFSCYSSQFLFKFTNPILNTMSQTVALKVAMSCQGCSGAVKRVLDKMEGVESYDINMEEQKVTVKGNVQPEAVLQTVSKTGKKTSFWEEATPAPAPADSETKSTGTETKPAEEVAAP